MPVLPDQLERRKSWGSRGQKYTDKDVHRAGFAVIRDTNATVAGV